MPDFGSGYPFLGYPPMAVSDIPPVLLGVNGWIWRFLDANTNKNPAFSRGYGFCCRVLDVDLVGPVGLEPTTYGL